MWKYTRIEKDAFQNKNQVLRDWETSLETKKRILDCNIMSYLMAMNVGQFPHRWRNWDVVLPTKEILKRIETIKKLPIISKKQLKLWGYKERSLGEINTQWKQKKQRQQDRKSVV